MDEKPGRGESPEPKKSDTRDELRTIGFRLREIQRLMSMRVQQENRRLEAEGIEPITDATFFKQSEGHRQASENAIRYLIETLAGLDIFQEASVTLVDGTTIHGRVNPITYTPQERLLLEIRPRDEDARYELRAEYTGERWSTPVIRRYTAPDDDWTELGEIDTMRTLE
ncbi:hypothetical protein [Haloarchaeobius sp. TZWWS8]|uniref:hypothetical protein n=1 Tax=Haloarchaeobius sp. TZWWS8 TaxID=3446121 RepID=UPI003EB81A73